MWNNETSGTARRQHSERSLTHLLDRTERQAMADRTCSVEDCEKRAVGRKTCGMHHQRLRRLGSTDLPARTRQTCSVDGCEKRYQCRGYCPMHYRRLRLNGSPFACRPLSAPPLLVGADHGRWNGDNITYGSAHDRVRRTRGTASAHACLHCGKAAQEWAYDHTDPDGKTEVRARDGRSPRPVAFSTDPAHYIPLCHRCHVKFDTGRA